MSDDVFTDLGLWIAAGKQAALATVIQTWGSSPRPVGSLMAVSQDGRISGSVSGGCVEGAVIDAALDVIQSGKPARLHFGVADDQAWEVGLACGGEIEVFVRRFRQEDLEIWKRALAEEKPFSALLVVDGVFAGQELIILGDGSRLVAAAEVFQDPGLSNLVDSDSQPGEKRTGTFSLPNGTYIFRQSILPPLRLIIIGGSHIAIPLVKIAHVLGLKTVVIDPRRSFSSPERFPEADQLIPEWPQSALKDIGITASTGIVMLTHDPKIDDPALMIALESPAFYIGALGSQKTHQKRLERLQAAGLEDRSLTRIHAPVGLDLGARTPEEIALSIMGEMIQVWHGSTPEE
jgi:xanthine dehydrogenase accessory factor